MADYAKVIRTFVGDASAAVGDGYAGFCLNRTYHLQVEHRSDGTVAIVPDHYEYLGPGVKPLVIKVEQYEKWFVK
jgi:hypothetical protein